MPGIDKKNRPAAVLILVVMLALGGMIVFLSGCEGGGVTDPGAPGAPGAPETGTPSGNRPIGNLSIGDRVVDYSWSGEGGKHVIWIVVAKDHYSGIDSHVTLLSEYMLNEIMAFDNSTRGEYGSNDWGTSGDPDATMGVREFLNSAFYGYMSEGFKSAILATTLPNTYYETTDKIFLPSHTELGGEPEWGEVSPVGNPWGYFTDAADRVAWMSEEHVKNWSPSDYFLRTGQPAPRGNPYDGNVFFVNYEGKIISIRPSSLKYLRPALNLSSGTPVSDSPDEDGFYLIINH